MCECVSVVSECVSECVSVSVCVVCECVSECVSECVGVQGTLHKYTVGYMLLHVKCFNYRF